MVRFFTPEEAAHEGTASHVLSSTLEFVLSRCKQERFIFNLRRLDVNATIEQTCIKQVVVMFPADIARGTTLILTTLTEKTILGVVRSYPTNFEPIVVYSHTCLALLVCLRQYVSCMCAPTSTNGLRLLGFGANMSSSIAGLSLIEEPRKQWTTVVLEDHSSARLYPS
jgi:hypothetical protein